MISVDAILEFFSAQSFWELVLATALGTLLATVIISLLVKLFSISLIQMSVVDEGNYDREKPCQEVKIENKGVPVWIVAKKLQLGRPFERLDARKLPTDEVYKICIEHNVYLKVRRWRGVLFFGTKTIKVTKAEVSSPRLFSRAKWCWAAWKKKHSQSNNIIAKDLRALLRLRPQCEKFCLRYTAPGGERKLQFSLWTFESNNLNDARNASSDWHYPEFTEDVLANLLKRNFSPPFSKFRDFEDVAMTREDVEFFILLLKQTKDFRKPKSAMRFRELYEPKLLPSVNASLKITPFRTTKSKHINIESSIQSNFFGSSIRWQPKSKDEEGYLFKEKKTYFFISTRDGLMIRGELEDLRHTRINPSEIINLRRLLQTWEKW